MKNRQTFFLAILWCIALGNVNAQSSTTKDNTAQKLIDMLVGKWQVTKINDGNKNTQVSSHPNAMQNIEFTREAKYIVKNNSVKADSGLFRTNEDHKIIYLESANHHDNPTEWKVDLKNNMLTLTQKETPTKEIHYVYIRQSSRQHPLNNKENDRR